MCSARMRAIASDGPPAENGTTMVTGREGKFWAKAGATNARAAANTASTNLRITTSVKRPPSSLRGAKRRSNPSFVTGMDGLLRFARNDGRCLQLREIDRLVAIERSVDLRQRIFEPCRAIKQHHAITLCNTTFGEALPVGGVGRRTLGAEQKPLLARHFIERSRNLLVIDRDGKSLALAHRAQDEKIPDRLRHADA